MPTPRLAIIADDLTGALDAAAPLAAAPGGVAVACRPDDLADAFASGAGIVAVSTRTREASPAVARDRVAAVVAALPPGIRIVKKIDSRLKGNVAEELEPLADRPLVVLPAIPELGRMVRDGSLEGFGVERPLPVRAALGRFGAAAHVPDTIRQCDMVREVTGAPAHAVLVGARGVTQALATVLGLPAPPAIGALPTPLCFVIGSTDPITLAQVEALRSARPDLVCVEAPAGSVPGPPPRGPGAQLLLLQVVAGPQTRPERVAEALARGALPYLQTVRSMLLTGGATAEAVLDALGIALLIVAGEALPGLPVCRAGGRMLVTKSGGFGSPDAFVRLAGAPAKAEA